MLNAVLKQFSQKTKALILIALGSITWSFTMVKSGWFYNSLGLKGSGLGFWGANGHDGIWHIALIESLKRGTLDMPVFAGQKIQNYHVGFDLILAFLSRITFIPVTLLYFQIIPVILSVLIGFLTYRFILNWTKSEHAALWSVFFAYFGGSLGWVLGNGESAFWSQQAITTLINPPFALSLVFILAGFLVLQKIINKYSFRYFLLAVVLFGSLVEIKAYAGILCLGGLLIAGLYTLVKSKSALMLKLFLISLAVAVILYLPLNKSSAGLLVFQPFWFLETLMGLTDRLNYQKFYMAMLTYKSGHNFVKMTPAYLVAFALFWIGNMGTRIIKDMMILKWIKNIKNLSWIEVFISSVIVAGVLIPMLFLQKGTPWNTIQFFYYSLFFSGLLAGVVASRIKNKLVLVVLVLLTIPTTIITLKDVYIPIRPPAMISKDELSALSFLAGQPAGVVLTKPFDEFSAKSAEPYPPRPLYLYESTAYVSALGKHQTFFEDDVNLDITGYNWQERRERLLSWYAEKDYVKSRAFLKDNSIKYIYWIKEGQSPLDLGKLGLVNVYENNLITIYEVN